MTTDISESRGRVVLETVQWTNLQMIEDLEPISDRDYNVLAELREVILRHGYENRFGISLLHKHFDLLTGEVALEETDEAARISTIRAVPENSCTGAMETTWRFTENAEINAGMMCEFKCRGSGMTNHNKYHTGRRI